MRVESLGGNQHSVSVCVLTAHRPKLLERLLTALLPQLSVGDEIIILDTDPSPENARLVEALHNAQCRYVPKHIKPFDFATARNALLEYSRCNCGVFIDDDALPFPDWLKKVRTNLTHYQAVGGVTVSASELPPWWDPAINWCIGLSPPGTVEGHPGFYPDTCNLGATRQLWQKNPLHTIPRKKGHLYSTGREDAEWWADRRREGQPVAVLYRQAVVHEVHQDRIHWKYVMQRAQADGQSHWLRRPEFETATAIPWDLAHIAGLVCDNVVRKPFQRSQWVNDYVWMNRQWGLFKAVWKAPIQQRPRHRILVKELAKATLFQGKIRAGAAAFKLVTFARENPPFPPAEPKTVFVSADCLFGDSVLLRPHIDSLARTFPEAEIIVSAKFPQLLRGLPSNAKVLAQAAASKLCLADPGAIDAAFVPYFYQGDYHLWRKHLSRVGTTFNCDTGFAGRRDTIYARRVINKNLEVHEHENLARLFRLWPLLEENFPDGPPLDDGLQDWIHGMLSQSGIGEHYVLIQFGAGYASKEWPLDRWLPFLRGFATRTGTPLIIIGGESWAEAGEIAARELSSLVRCINLVGKTTIEQVMALVKTAAFYMGGCSGPKHLAFSYRVPTFTLYTATEPERWGAARDHTIHAYVKALPQKLTGAELHGLRDDHRSRLLDPVCVAERAVNHYFNTTTRRGLTDSSAEPAG